MNTKNFCFEQGKIVLLKNPLSVLNETHEFLHMSYHPHKPAADIIWGHDNELLQESLAFHRTLREHFGLARDEYFKLNDILENEKPQGDTIRTPGGRFVPPILPTKPVWSCSECCYWSVKT
jgi:hypothetical protein